MSRIEHPGSGMPSSDTQMMLDSLTKAVHEALENKRKLGQYAVLWRDGKPVAVGEDAPADTGPDQDR